MTIPVYVLGAISVVTQAWWSDKVHKRAIFLIGSAVPVVAGYLICVGTPHAGAGYFAMFLLASGRPYQQNSYCRFVLLMRIRLLYNLNHCGYVGCH